MTAQLSFWLFTGPIFYWLFRLFQLRGQQYGAAIEYNGDLQVENRGLVEMLTRAHRIYENCEAYDNALCRDIFSTSEYLLFRDDMENLLKRKKFNN